MSQLLVNINSSIFVHDKIMKSKDIAGFFVGAVQTRLDKKNKFKVPNVRDDSIVIKVTHKMTKMLEIKKLSKEQIQQLSEVDEVADGNRDSIEEIKIDTHSAAVSAFRVDLDWTNSNKKCDCGIYAFNAMVGVNCVKTVNALLRKTSKLSNAAYIEKIATKEGIRLNSLPEVPVFTNIQNKLRRTWVKINHIFEDDGACTRLMRKTGPHAEIMLDYLIPTQRGILRLDLVNSGGASVTSHVIAVQLKAMGRWQFADNDDSLLGWNDVSGVHFGTFRDKFLLAFGLGAYVPVALSSYGGVCQEWEKSYVALVKEGRLTGPSLSNYIEEHCRKEDQKRARLAKYKIQRSGMAYRKQK